MKHAYKNYLLMVLSALMALTSNLVHAEPVKTELTSEALNALHDTIIKDNNPYYAIQNMIRDNPEWMEWIAHHLRLLEATQDSDEINIEHEVSVIVTEGNVRDVLAAYQRTLLSEFTVYCQNNGYNDIDTTSMWMQFRAHIAREGRAFPACGFHFNTFSYHPEFRHTFISLPSYCTWMIDSFSEDYTFGKHVNIAVHIVEINHEEGYYKVDLTFCAIKEQQLRPHLMRHNV